jgi:hypothetical protein
MDTEARRRRTIVVYSFHELPLEVRGIVVNSKTGITAQEAEKHLEVVLNILKYKTGL